MKRVHLSLYSFLALAICFASVGMMNTARAQTRDKYVISAKAGGINYITGDVIVTRKGAQTPETLTDKDNLESGDVVETNGDGRIEVLLNPGSYLRVGENSEFEFTSSSLDRLSIKLRRGSAVIEAVGTDDTALWLEVQTPQTRAEIVKRGVYRINVLPTGETEVLVRKGRALVGANSEVVKGGQKIIVGRGRVETAKIDKKLQDSLDLWSRERAEYLASINRRLRDNTRTLTASITDYSIDVWTRIDRSRTYGVWVYDGNRRCYVFVPTIGGNWSSPYGYGYGGTPCCNAPRNNGPNPSQPAPPQTGPVAGPTTPTPPASPDTPPSETPPYRPQPERPIGDSRPNRPSDDGGPREIERPRERDRDTSSSVNRPEPAPQSAPRESTPPSPPPQSAPPPSPPPQPAYTPPPSPPSNVERTVEAPRERENPND